METLASRIARDGGLQEVDAVGWAIRVARTIEQSHDRGRTHGRISADGVLIASEQCTSEGRLIPFAELPENVAYHSPERELGEGGSQDDDTWAVAVLLYFALAGSLPFSGFNDDDVRRKIRSVPAPPLAVYDVGDDELQGIVDRALARDRAGRTSGVAALRRELEAWHPDLGLHELPALLADEEMDEDVTMIHMSGGQDVRRLIEAAIQAKQGQKPQALKPQAASAPNVQLAGLVDEESASEESNDPFAVPASRADVRVGSAPRSIPPGAHSPSVAPPSARGPASSQPTSTTMSQAPLPPDEMPRPQGSRATIIAIAVVLALAALAIGAFSFDLLNGSPPTPPAPSAKPDETPTPPATTPRPAALARGTGATSAPPGASSASVAPGASASPGAKPGDSTAARVPGNAGELAACVLPTFPPESFDPSTDFGFLCAEADPAKLGAAIRTELVRTHRNMSDGMREWALLGWYELPAVALLRARCCPSAPPLALPDARGCSPVADVLGAIASAAAAAEGPADKALQKAVDGYTSETYCAVRSGIAHRFGRRDKPEGGEDTTFARFLARFVKTKR
jgi:hypothetical protein